MGIIGEIKEGRLVEGKILRNLKPYSSKSRASYPKNCSAKQRLNQ